MGIESSDQDFVKIEKLIPDQIQELRKILEEKHNIIVPTHCDDLLARCIRMKDGNLEAAIKLAHGFHTATGNFPSWDAIFKPTRDIEGFKAGELMAINQRDSNGRIVTVCRPGEWEPDTRSFDQAMANIWMFHQYITAQSKDAQRNGIVMIYDFAGVSMKHIWPVKTWRIPYLARIVQNGLGGRIKEFQIINHPKIISATYSKFVKPWLKEKLKKRITFHDSLESLHSHFDKNGLPTFIGGCQEISECMDSKLMNDFLSQDQYFIDMLRDRFPRY